MSAILKRALSPRLAISQGDPLGIGPEIIAKAFIRGELNDALVVGDPAILRRALAACGLTAPVAVLSNAADWPDVPPGCLPVWIPPGMPADLAQLPWGRVHAQAGAAAAACVRGAATLALNQRVGAVVTAPLHKEALSAAGEHFPGHTEMLQAMCGDGEGVPAVRMMLANDELRVVLVTIHVALRRAIDSLDTAGILETLRITDHALRRFGIEAPRIAVAGLNPHAGEGGLFGDEELTIIEPAVRRAQSVGIDASGPFAPDTVFMRARNSVGHTGEFDAVVAMTHDHGLIPVKYLGVEKGVNVTLGLPFVRTSPDHGTAFDIAGRGTADESSLLAATHMARRLAANDVST